MCHQMCIAITFNFQLWGTRTTFFQIHVRIQSDTCFTYIIIDLYDKRILLFASENVRNDVIAIYRPPSVRQPSGHYFFKIFWNSLSNSFTNYKLYESIFHIYTYAWYNININFNVSYSYCKSDVLINLFVYICIHNVYHIYIYIIYSMLLNRTTIY